MKSEEEIETDDVTLDVIALEKLPLADEDPLDVAKPEVVAEGDDVGVREFRFVAVTVVVAQLVDDADSDANADTVNCEADVVAELIADLVYNDDTDSVSVALVLSLAKVLAVLLSVDDVLLEPDKDRNPLILANELLLIVKVERLERDIVDEAIDESETVPCDDFETENDTLAEPEIRPEREIESLATLLLDTDTEDESVNV